MKTFQFSSLILLLMVVTSCNDLSNLPDPIEPKDTIKYVCPTCPVGVPFDSVDLCPFPFDTNSVIGTGQPRFEHDAHGPSINGDLLIIAYTTILDLKNLQIIKLNPFDIIPKEYNIEGGYIPCFSPTENSKVLLVCGGFNKNSNGKIVGGQTYFIVDIYTKQYVEVTPTKFGKYGVEYQGDGGLLSWTFDNFNKTDKLHFSDTIGDYIVQEDRFVNIPSEQLRGVAISPNNQYRIEKYHNAQINQSYFKLNGNRLPLFEQNFANAYSMAWSKDSRYLAITGFNRPTNVINKNEYAHIWIFDMQESVPNSSSFKYKYKITPRKQFCKYIWSGGTERQLAFISPTTLAVPMQDHNGDIANVHEINIDGKYVRQLTFVK